VIVEVNSETDFVARNAEFQKLVAGSPRPRWPPTARSSRGAGCQDVSARPSMRRSRQRRNHRREHDAATRRDGEAPSDGVVASYVHSAVAPGLGKIGVLVGLRSSGDGAKLGGIGRQVAMHIAASSPLAVRVEELDSEVVARERAVYAEQARESGKPEAIIEKMVEGRMRKFHEEVVLLSQAFVIDTEKTVAQALKAAEAEVGGPIAVTAFAVFRLGEGVERTESDFAAEVAAAAGQK
jgi:elongation factor Ts